MYISCSLSTLGTEIERGGKIKGERVEEEGKIMIDSSIFMKHMKLTYFLTYFHY